MATQTGKRRIGLVGAGALLLCLFVGIWYLQAAGPDTSNPHANFWRAVRHGIPGFSTVSSQGHRVLILNSGENWREVRNGFIMKGSQWILGVALAVMVLFYAFVGSDKLENPRSGVKIERFNLGERILHWFTALMFVVMGITGLSLLLGRPALIPIAGHRVVSAWLGTSKILHNYCGPLLLAGILLAAIIWVRFNIPRKADLAWFRNMGGMVGHGPRPPAGKVNGGEKGWFWLMVIFGIAVGVTGITLDFPVWGQTRFVMQLSHIIHVMAAILFIAASFGHIYTGTIGAEGVFEGMWTGSVDAVWAQQHAGLWYREKTSGTAKKP